MWLSSVYGPHMHALTTTLQMVSWRDLLPDLVQDIIELQDSL